MFEDPAGCFAERYDSQPGTLYLIRPDQHVAARFREFDAGQIKTVLTRAICIFQQLAMEPEKEMSA